MYSRRKEKCKRRAEDPDQQRWTQFTARDELRSIHKKLGAEYIRILQKVRIAEVHVPTCVLPGEGAIMAYMTEPGSTPSFHESVFLNDFPIWAENKYTRADLPNPPVLPSKLESVAALFTRRGSS